MKPKKKFILILLFFFIGIGLGITGYVFFFKNIWSNTTKQRISQNVPIMNDKKARSLINILQQPETILSVRRKIQGSAQAEITIQKTLEKIQQQILSHGVHPILLRHLFQFYFAWDMNAKALLFCQSMADEWYRGDLGYGKSIVFSIQNHSHKIWHHKTLSPHCLRALFATGHYSHAIGILQAFEKSAWVQAIAMEEKSLIILTSYYQTKNFTKASNFCRDHILSIQTSEKLLAHCGKTHKKLQKWTLAKENFIAAYKLSGNKGYLKEIANIYLQLGQKDKASAILHRVP